MNIIRSSYVDFRFVNGVAKHPDLQSDPTFVDFLEVEGDLPRATSTSALSGAGVLRLFSRVGDSIGKITYKMDESNPVITFISLMQLPETAIYITNHLYIIIVCLLQFKIFFSGNVAFKLVLEFESCHKWNSVLSTGSLLVDGKMMKPGQLLRLAFCVFLSVFTLLVCVWKDIGAQFTEYLTTVLQSSYDKCQSCDRLTILVQFTKHLTKVSYVRFTCRIARSCEIVLN